MKIKLICGFRKDQEYTIDIQEAHKAYYLWHNKEASAIFEGGLAIEGSDLKRIVPDYNATMGWNATHVIDDYDMNELRENGILLRLRNAMAFAKNISEQVSPQELALPLSSLKEKYNYAQLRSRTFNEGDSIKNLLPNIPERG